MKRFGPIIAVLAFAFALLVGAAGGALAQGDSMDHHGSHHPPSHSVPSPGDSHKAALAVVAPCCPAAEAPADHVITVTLAMTETSWHPRPENIPGARDIAPEPYPPKPRL